VRSRFRAAHGANWAKLPSYAVFQMNDTHPTVAVAELMRLLLDAEGLPWDQAWSITQETLAFTNHTVMPEALEKWPVTVFEKLLPRCAEIVARVDADWRASLRPKIAADVAAAAAAAPPKPKKEVVEDKKGAAGAAAAAEPEPAAPDPVEAALNKYGVLVENPWEPGVKLVNMAHLAIVGSKAVNGVAAIHSEILKADLFADFYALFPDKFQNKTNGVTPRRWLAFCNPGLSALITSALGSDAWIRDASLLTGLLPRADDPGFRAQWVAVKQANKARLATKVKALTGVDLPTTAMFDVHIKRIHEYKRQLMNVLSVIVRYRAIKAATPAQRKAMVPRAVIFGGKAASAYRAAKKIVRLITAVGAVVNNDPEVGDLLKVRGERGERGGGRGERRTPLLSRPSHPPFQVVFLPDYNVSLAEVIIPATELSQHISTAGTEASGTSNMKFAMNGSLIIGTMDGANVEIAEEAGKSNLFVFGVDAEDVPRLRTERSAFKDYDADFLAALKDVADGKFGDAAYLQVQREGGAAGEREGAVCSRRGRRRRAPTPLSLLL